MVKTLSLACMHDLSSKTGLCDSYLYTLVVLICVHTTVGSDLEEEQLLPVCLTAKAWLLLIAFPRCRRSIWCLTSMVISGFLLVHLLLMLSGDIETNPGPDPPGKSLCTIMQLHWLNNHQQTEMFGIFIFVRYYMLLCTSGKYWLTICPF